MNQPDLFTDEAPPPAAAPILTVLPPPAAQDPAPRNARALVAQVIAADQDFEFYPTTSEIIGALIRNLNLAPNSFGNWQTTISTVLDIGAGNGKVGSGLLRSYEKQKLDIPQLLWYCVRMSETKTVVAGERTQFAPPPWRVDPANANHGPIITAGNGMNGHGRDVAAIYGDNAEEREATAILIASAPALLAALKALTEVGHYAGLDIKGSVGVKEMKSARAVIAKAEGK